ncbi:DNA-binding protein, partial [Enterococcus faecalis]|nr:DNA-binding protein [Enterococcus faecalis]
KIKNYFGKAYPLAFYDYEVDASEVDLVISNYYFDTKGTTLLLMKNIPTERNWRNLEKILYKITHCNDK